MRILMSLLMGFASVNALGQTAVTLRAGIYLPKSDCGIRIVGIDPFTNFLVAQFVANPLADLGNDICGSNSLYFKNAGTEFHQVDKDGTPIPTGPVECYGTPSCHYLTVLRIWNAEAFALYDINNSSEEFVLYR